MDEDTGNASGGVNWRLVDRRVRTMRDPLENVTIGNFLYGLGVSIGARAGVSAPPGCVNLLQQSPMDPPLGDVMLHYPGVFRLIEFKRRAADKTKERVKHTKLASGLTSREDLRHISREVHWYVETEKGVPEFHVTAKRYLDMFDNSVPTDGLTEFIVSLVEQALCPKPVCDLKLLPQYLDAVAVLAGPSVATSSGMLISVGADGGMQYAVVENIRDIHLPHKLFLERGFDRGPSIQREREKVRVRSRGLTR